MNSITTPSSKRRAWLILGFCGLYLGIQLLLIVRGHFVPSKHFGFWMFPESTHFTATLSRVLPNGKEVKTKRGIWTVETKYGKVRYKWNTFVNGYRMDALDERQRCKGTFADTVKYYQAALNYVAARIPEDTETQQLIMRIQYRRAGEEKELLVLRSVPCRKSARDDT
jgi:hypothetical protein